MREPTEIRLFVDAELPGRIGLTGKQVNYLRNVLRLGVGARFSVFNGRQGAWLAEIIEMTKNGGVAGTTALVRAQTPAPQLVYAFAPLKQARLDYMVEKAAEAGAGHLQPVLTQHCQVRKINRERLRANIIEACEQCGILTVPTIADPVPLTSFLGNVGDHTLVVADEALAGEPIDPVAAIRAAAPPLAVLIGPEGGFSEQERALLAPRAVRVSLGPRVLRADTAAVALLALVEAAHPSVS
ncbi:16S rRNA (uracil(1498)-N(3))-methyltransferase [Acuticoccus sp. MNP-M23]|uniref:16S rRNA (uracil(1498)-N(3))-methyltransferase n=1 Tax=Acuticoccus sp. MNP-M23 TaxID=3072793 RepID=UPI0028162C9D|nr:16S rRNA (uracil(1498)-N(3))-methyltransferase [Acuticoccus sp. MNP-M23]WMS44745.1 16S rRNA (uracil(1498)-N(3))-methyltransferase [Acuticoccus sp. MNP-M23]